MTVNDEHRDSEATMTHNRGVPPLPDNHYDRLAKQVASCTDRGVDGSGRRDAIVRLLETLNEGLPEPVRRVAGQAGFVGGKDAAGRQLRWLSCPDCLANGRTMFGCETCGGRGEIPDDDDLRDPYSVNEQTPRYGLDGAGHDAAHRRDREIEALAWQTRPAVSERVLLEEANRRGFGWEEARRGLFRRFDYPLIGRLLDELRAHDPDACRALHAVYVYAWAPRTLASEACERGLVFLDERLPDPLRAPAPAPQRRIVAKVERSAGGTARATRDDRIRELANAGMRPAEIAAECFVSIRTVYNVCRNAA